MEMPCGDVYSYREGGLYIGDVSVAEVAQVYGTPLYLYSATQIQKNIALIRKHVNQLNHRLTNSQKGDVSIFYAMKANRFRKVMDLIRGEKDIGIDACSPAEVAYSRECGFQTHEISFTGCFLSNKDIQFLAEDGVHVNFDTLTAIRKYAALVPPNTKIGLRLNPGFDLGFAPNLRYNEKFGFSASQFDEVLKEVKERGLIVDTLHYHCGWNYPANIIPAFEQTLGIVLECAQKIGETLEVVDVGGGLGVLHHSSQSPSMDAETWARTLDAHLVEPLSKTNKNVRIICEPGTRIVADAGLLVSEVNTVEARNEATWIGLNVGKNINCYQAYGLPLTILSVKGDTTTILDGASRITKNEATNNGEYKREEEREGWGTYNIAGNINEGCDMFGDDVKLPTVNDGDFLALFPCGAYGSSMMSNHCLRGECKEVVLQETKNSSSKRKWQEM